MFGSGAELFLFYFLGWIIGVFAHESAHALAGWLVGYPPRLIRVGVGRLIAKFRLRSAEVEIRLQPFCGGVLAYPVVFERPLMHGLFVSAGMLANLALIVAAVAFWYLGNPSISAKQALLGFSGAQATIFFASLLAGPSDRDSNLSDGVRLWRLLNSPRSGLTDAGKIYLKLLARYTAPADPAKSLTSSSPRIIYLIGQRGMAADAVARRLNNAQLNVELSMGKLSAAEEVCVLDLLVTRAVLSGCAGEETLLDAWSARALALAPHIPTVRFSRAAALIELGRYTEGRALLLDSLTLADSNFDTTINTIFLAKAELALGNGDLSRDLLAKAERHIEADILEDRRDQLRDLLSRTRLAMAEPA